MCPSGRTQSPDLTTITAFRPAFDGVNTDRDGKISVNDLKTYSGFSNTNTATEEDIGSMISVADSNKDGFVELDEFERVLGCERNINSLGNEVMVDAFKVMDKNGDGKVGFDDLRTYMKRAGFSASDDDIRSMIKMGGGDENGGVCFEGLLKILAFDSL